MKASNTLTAARKRYLRLLFKKVLHEAGCPDVEPFELIQGLDLVGTAKKSRFFDAKLVPATTSPEFALLTASWQRHKIEPRDVHALELLKLLREATLHEVKAGFLEGPQNNLCDLQTKLGCNDVVVRRRFAIIHDHSSCQKRADKKVHVFLRDGVVLESRDVR